MNILCKFLNSISSIACYIAIVSILFIIQHFTIGLIPPLSHIIILNKIYLKDILFISNSIYISIKYFEVSTPYKAYKSKN